MTVQEVLAAMIGAYRGFDSAAVAAMAGVFQQKLEKYEGPELKAAWLEVASGFDAKPSKPYPLPKDFEEVLPRAAKMPKGASAAALDFKAHGERKAALLADWCEWERPAIVGQFGPRVAFWCEHEVRARAATLAWKDDASTVRLGSKDIALIVESVVSRDRADTYGTVSHPDTWRDQMELCRHHVVAGRYSRSEIAEPVLEPKGARRATVDLRPDEFVEVGEPPSWVSEAMGESDVPE